MQETTERKKAFSEYLNDMERAGILLHRSYYANRAIAYADLLAKLDETYKGFEGGLCLEDLAEYLLAAAGIDLDAGEGADDGAREAAI